jgi:hypothetical protein
MTANSEFQASLKEGHIAEAISLVVSRLVELDIVTALPAINGSAGKNVLSTKVNLLSGLITNEVDVEFVQNQDYEKFLNFHTAQVVATSQMVREQLQGMQSLLGFPGNSTVPTSSLPVGKAATIETPKASNDTMPVVAPAIEMRPIAAEPPTIVSHSPAEVATACPNRDLVPQASVSTADLLDEPTLDMETPAEVDDSFTPGTPTIIQIDRDRSVDNQVNSQPAQPVPPVTISASAMSAAIAQAGSPDLSEANTIPNKLDQAFRSAGVKPEEGVHPFDSEPVVEKAAPVYSPASSDQDLLKEPDEQWDEWLLEEEDILSELSQASRAVTKEKIPDLNDNWFPQPTQGEDSTMDDWEKFIPEYTEPNSTANKGQANVERFRQNLVNDPQLMNELLAELDDIEHLGEGNSPQSPSKNGEKTS